MPEYMKTFPNLSDNGQKNDWNILEILGIYTYQQISFPQAYKLILYLSPVYLM